MAKRKGIAIMIVLFFAFAVGIVMFSMFQANTNLSNQTKKTIYAMQAYYLAHSCMQFGKLQISLLPKEIYDYYGNGGNSGNALALTESGNILSMAMEGAVLEGYDLYKPNKDPNDKFPYEGRFKITNLEYVLSNDDMKMVQDSYRLHVEAYVSHGRNKEFTDSMTEEFVVSRFSGR
jgi:hypothetical protein